MLRWPDGLIHEPLECLPFATTDGRLAAQEQLLNAEAVELMGRSPAREHLRSAEGEGVTET